MRHLPTLTILVLACACSAALGQWQWVDETGRKVYSDLPPPATVPDKNIVRRPAAPASTASSPRGADRAGAASALDTGTAGGGSKAMGSDTELEARKKLLEDAESAKKKAEEDRIARLKADNCARARQAKLTYVSGVRIARNNAAGEREILDDAARAAEIKRIDGIIASDCK